MDTNLLLTPTWLVTFFALIVGLIFIITLSKERKQLQLRIIELETPVYVSSKVQHLEPKDTTTFGHSEDEIKDSTMQLWEESQIIHNPLTLDNSFALQEEIYEGFNAVFIDDEKDDEKKLCACCSHHRSFHDDHGSIQIQEHDHVVQNKITTLDPIPDVIPCTQACKELERATTIKDADVESSRSSSQANALHVEPSPEITILPSKVQSQHIDNHAKVNNLDPLEPKHKIFLSHSGSQKDFVEQLCEDLERDHHFPFFDNRPDSLPKGEEFPKLIFKAAKQCKVAVVVLSEDYFTKTKWPMLELVEFVEAKQCGNPNIKILPLYFKLSPKECFDVERWLRVWNRWSQDDVRINVSKWKEALKVLSPTNGIIYKEHLTEVGYRREVVQAINNLVRPHVKYEDAYVQGGARFCEIIRQKFDENELSAKYGVHVVGLYGMGGIGKTTMCKTLCDAFFVEFGGKVCHVELEKKKPKELQKDVLKRLTGASNEFVDYEVTDETKIRNEFDVKPYELGGSDVLLTNNEDLLDTHLGRSLLRSRLRERMGQQKVFLALDNVWDSTNSRNEALSYIEAGFFHESWVLITARSLEILEQLNIDQNNCVEMPELDNMEATNLFISHAKPKDMGYFGRSIIEKCVRLCSFRKVVTKGTRFQYHPLALKVLAGQLRTISDDLVKWEDPLDKLGQKLDLNLSKEKVHPVFSILRTGYDTLQEAEQLMFMDVALFLPLQWSWKRICASRGVTNELGLYDVHEWLKVVHSTNAMDSLRSLKNKSLIEDFGDGFSNIIVHDLYKDFAECQAKEMAFHERRWLYHDYDKNKVVDREAMQNMWSQVYSDLQRTPPGKCWPNLERIKIHHGGIESLGRDRMKYFSNIQVLELGNCPHLHILDLHGLRRLRSLDVRKCPNMERVHGIEDLDQLYYFRWLWIPGGFGFDGVTSFPGKSLQILVLEMERNTKPGLQEITILPSLAACTNLRELILVGFANLESFPNLTNMIFLQKVHFEQCGKASSLLGLSSKMSALKELHLFHNNKINKLQGVGEVIALEKLTLNVNNSLFITSFPNLEKLKNLRVLDIENSSFTELTCVAQLTQLRELWCTCATNLTSLPDLSNLIDLEVIGLEMCISVTNLQFSNIDRLTNLRHLLLGGTNISRIPDLHNAKDLKELDVSYSTIIEIPEPFSKLATIPKLGMKGCLKLRERLLTMLREGVLDEQQMSALVLITRDYKEDSRLDSKRDKIHENELDDERRHIQEIGVAVNRLLRYLVHSENLSKLRNGAAKILSNMVTSRKLKIKVLETIRQVDGGIDIVIEAFHNHKDLGDLFWVVQEYIHSGDYLTTQTILQSQLLCCAIMRYLLDSPTKIFNDWTEQMCVDAIKILKFLLGNTNTSDDLVKEGVIDWLQWVLQQYDFVQFIWKSISPNELAKEAQVEVETILRTLIPGEENLTSLRALIMEKSRSNPTISEMLATEVMDCIQYIQKDHIYHHDSYTPAARGCSTYVGLSLDAHIALTNKRVFVEQGISTMDNVSGLIPLMKVRMKPHECK